MGVVGECRGKRPGIGRRHLSGPLSGAARHAADRRSALPGRATRDPGDTHGIADESIDLAPAVPTFGGTELETRHKQLRPPTLNPRNYAYLFVKRSLFKKQISAVLVAKHAGIKEVMAWPILKSHPYLTQQNCPAGLPPKTRRRASHQPRIKA